MADLDWGAAVDSQEQTLTTQVSSPTGNSGKGRRLSCSHKSNVESYFTNVHIRLNDDLFGICCKNVSYLNI